MKLINSIKAKVPGQISQNGDIYSNEASLSKKSWFQISDKSVEPFGYEKRFCVLQLPIQVMYLTV